MQRSYLFIIIIFLFISCGNGSDKKLRALQAKYDSLYTLHTGNMELNAEMRLSYDSLIQYNREPFLLVSEQCNSEECLLRMGEDQYFGIAWFDGYYTQHKEDNCDGFVIMDGPKPMIQMYRDMVDHGNSVNNIEDGNLILNIDLTTLDKTTADYVKRTTVDSPVRIHTIVALPEGVCVEPCFSFLDIFRISLLADSRPQEEL